jgi:hypothetical protein
VKTSIVASWPEIGCADDGVFDALVGTPFPKEMISVMLAASAMTSGAA